ncbi:MAG: hypothetical protein KBD51_03185 [Candidatus Levybacteria bacterium]|nr:hypothetical protein [Candidatus Levybacteria bacterium]
MKRSHEGFYGDLEKDMGPYVALLAGEPTPIGVIPVKHVQERQIPGIELLPEGTALVPHALASDLAKDVRGDEFRHGLTPQGLQQAPEIKPNG